jgi:CubicO group peptidase (beta-lactamase class C family)
MAERSSPALIAGATLLLAAGLAAQAPAPAVLLSTERFEAIEPLVTEAIADKKLPGAVVLVGHRDRIVYHAAIGNRPAVEPMTLDTVFDLASLTKVVATTTAVMMLVEEGRIRLNDRVSTYMPGFERYGKGRITVRHLLTHTSGLRPDVDLATSGPATTHAIELRARGGADSRRRASASSTATSTSSCSATSSGGERAAARRFARERIFEPLGMTTHRLQSAGRALRPRIAPTERCTPYGWPCEGARRADAARHVHDPTARRMGGVAGHAGLFSTAADLSRFAGCCWAGTSTACASCRR